MTRLITPIFHYSHPKFFDHLLIYQNVKTEAISRTFSGDMVGCLNLRHKDFPKYGISAGIQQII